MTNVYKAQKNPAAGEETADNQRVVSDAALAEERRVDTDRRRSAKGLLELRARWDGVVDDRREAQRRNLGQSLLQRLPLLAWLTRRTKSNS